MKHRPAGVFIAIAGLCLSFIQTGLGQQQSVETAYSPPVRENTTQLLWGNTHLNTTLSADAYTNDVRVTTRAGL